MLAELFLALLLLTSLNAATIIPPPAQSIVQQPQGSSLSPSLPDICRQISVQRTPSAARDPLPGITTFYTILRILHSIAVQDPVIIFNSKLYNPVGNTPIGIIFPRESQHKNLQRIFAAEGLWRSAFVMARPDGSGLVESSFDIRYEGSFVGKVVYRPRRLSIPQLRQLSAVPSIGMETLSEETDDNSAVGIKIGGRGSRIIRETDPFAACTLAMAHLSRYPLIQRMTSFAASPEGFGVNVRLWDSGRERFPFVQNAIGLDATLALAKYMAGLPSDELVELRFTITVYGQEVGGGILQNNPA